MGVKVEAKAKVRDRQRTVAQHFRKWKSDNPKASLEEQVKTLDFLSDTAYLNTQINATENTA